MEEERVEEQRHRPTVHTMRSIESTSEHLLLDQIITEYGYSKHLWSMILVSFFTLFICGYNTTYFHTMVTAYQQAFKLDHHHISLVGCLFYVFKGIGFLTTGHIVKYTTRGNLTKIILSILVLLGYFREVANNYYILIINRCITGLLTAVVEIFATNILCESLPKSFRAGTLVMVWTGFALGQLAPNGIMFYTMPNFEVSGISPTHYYISIFNTVLLFFILFYFHDSARNLLLNGNTREALDLLYKMKSNPRRYYTAEVEKKIVTEIHMQNDVVEPSILELFHHSYLKLTLCLMVLFTTISYYSDGLNLVYTFILGRISNDHDHDPANFVGDVFFINLLNLASNMANGVLLEVKFFGRKRTILLLIFGLVIICILCLIFVPKTALFLGIFQFMNVIGDVIKAYTSEVYPTRIRDISTGFLNAIALIGSIISQFGFIYIYRYHHLAPFYMIIISLALCAVAALWLPVESYQRPLDLQIVEKNEEEISLLNQES